MRNRYVQYMKNHDIDIYDLKEISVDYFAILIYLWNGKPDSIKKIMQDFVEIYVYAKQNENKENEKHPTRWLYKELKLYSCWISLFENLKEINKPIIKLLKKDFYEPTFPNRVSIPSLFEQYGYPENNISRLSGIWYLHPSYMWGNKFQDEISNKLNVEEGKNYIEFHKMLKQNDTD